MTPEFLAQAAEYPHIAAALAIIRLAMATPFSRVELLDASYENHRAIEKAYTIAVKGAYRPQVVARLEEAMDWTTQASPVVRLVTAISTASRPDRGIVTRFNLWRAALKGTLRLDKIRRSTARGAGFALQEYRDLAGVPMLTMTETKGWAAQRRHLETYAEDRARVANAANARRRLGPTA